MERLISIDYGDKRIGIAVSDPFNNMALPLQTIIKKDRFTIKPYVKQIGILIKEYQASKIILGFPKNMDNTIGERGQITLDFKDRLSRNFKKIEIILWDERLTSIASKKLLSLQGVPLIKQKFVIDQVSASLILQNYLDYTRGIDG